VKCNIHKRLTSEDKFGRHYFCKHARLNLVRLEKRYNKRKLRRLFKYEISDN
jgi:hypothetical protein